MLKDILSDLSDWLKFAEAKHAAYLGFGLAALAIICNNLKGITIHATVLVIADILFMLPSIIAQIPFSGDCKPLVALTNYYYSNRKSSNTPTSHLFYVDIFLKGTSDKTAFIEEYNQLLPEDLRTPFDDEYLEQIFSISRIACIKYFLATVSSCVLLIEVALGVVLLIIA